MFKNLKLGTIVTASLIFGLSGCSVKQDTQTSEKIVELQKQIESKDIKISELEGKVSKDTLLPPNARAGECYTKVIIPAVYETKESDSYLEGVSLSDPSEDVLHDDGNIGLVSMVVRG